MYAKMIEDMQANMKQAFDVKSYEVAMKPMTDLFEVHLSDQPKDLRAVKALNLRKRYSDLIE